MAGSVRIPRKAGRSHTDFVIRPFCEIARDTRPAPAALSAAREPPVPLLECHLFGGRGPGRGRDDERPGRGRRLLSRGGDIARDLFGGDVILARLMGEPFGFFPLARRAVSGLLGALHVATGDRRCHAFLGPSTGPSMGRQRAVKGP